jgi:putative MATE family efflux protein
MMGTIFIFGYNAISSVLRGMGDSKRPLYFVFIACLANVVLDLLFVGVFKTGAAGAAIATIISQALSVLLSAVYLHKNDFIFDFRLKSFKIHKDKLIMLFKIGLPSSVQNVVVSLSFIFITAMVNGFGVDASAAVGIVGKFNSLAILPTIAMSMSISSMSGQNIGAGYFDRALKTMWTGIRIISVFGICIFTLVQIFPGFVLSVFTDEQKVIEYGILYIRTFSFDYLILTVVFSINGLINGSGHTTFSLINSMLSSVLIRVPVSYIFGLTLNLGLLGIGMGAPVASFIALITGFIYLRSGRWKKPKLDKIVNAE